MQINDMASITLLSSSLALSISEYFVAMSARVYYFLPFSILRFPCLMMILGYLSVTVFSSKDICVSHSS